MTYMPTITCFQFQLCTHVDYQLCKQQNEKKKTTNRPTISRVLRKQTTITSPLPAPKNSFWERSGLGETQDWLYTQCCSRSSTLGTSCDAGLAAQIQGSTSVPSQQSQHHFLVLWTSGKNQGLWKTSDLSPVHKILILQPSVLRNQNTWYARSARKQKKWRGVC